jgi:invasion protein IalB
MASHPRNRHRAGPVAGALGLALAALAPLSAPAQEAAEGGATPPLTFQDWQFRCEVPEGASEERCAIFQNIVVRESQQQLLNFAVTIPQEDRPPAGVLLLPLGISLPMGVGLAVDEEDPSRLAVEHCVQIGCRAVFPIQDELLAKMKAGKEAKVTFHDGARRPITIPVSLSGFTAAFNTLQDH